MLPGDGVGPEVTGQALRVLDWVITHRGLDVDVAEHAFGVAHYAETGRMIGEAALEAVDGADAILFGAVGGGSYGAIPIDIRRGQGLLGLRRRLGLFANLRPVRWLEPLADASPIKAEVAAGADLVVVRELAGGIYFGEPRGMEMVGDGERRSFNTMTYSSGEIRRIARTAFELAATRRGRVCSVDKANVLEVGELWRDVVSKVQHAEFPEIRLEHLFVDNAAMQIVRDPTRFDVIVTSNLFGDVLSDLAGAIVASLGMLPSASLSAPDRAGRRNALYEPVHGSAPDIAGRGIANPIAAILSVAMMLRHSLGCDAEATLVEHAVEQALEAGVRTADLIRDGLAPASTREMGDAVLDALANGATERRSLP